MDAPAPISEAVNLPESAAVDIGRPLTPSSRSSSPASDDIDEEPPSGTFVSPKSTRVTRSATSGSTSTAAARGGGGRQPGDHDGRDPAAAGAGNKRGKAQHGRSNSHRDGQDYARRGNDAYDGEILPGHGHPGMNPLDRLLDIDYARDFGDPVARYDAMRNQPPQAMNQTVAATAAPPLPPSSTAPIPTSESTSQPPSSVDPPKPSSEPAPTATAEATQFSEGTASEAPEAEVKMDTTA